MNFDLLCLLVIICVGSVQGETSKLTDFNLITLKKYNITDVSLSGISSGAYMAVQFHIAHSSFVSGVGIFAGGKLLLIQVQLNLN